MTDLPHRCDGCGIELDRHVVVDPDVEGSPAVDIELTCPGAWRDDHPGEATTGVSVRSAFGGDA